MACLYNIFVPRSDGSQYGSDNDALHYEVVRDYEANAGLDDVVLPIDVIYDDVIQSMCPQNSAELNIASPPISRADFYTLAGVLALDRMRKWVVVKKRGNWLALKCCIA